MKEGTGIRVWTARRNSLRAEILRVLSEHPKAVLSRKQLAQGFGVSVDSVDIAVQQLKREGVIQAVSGYMLVGIEPPPIRKKEPPARPKEKRPTPAPAQWPRVPNSVFQLAQTL